MEVCKKCGNPKDLYKEVEKHKIPYECGSCGGIDFPVTPARDLVFVWPSTPAEETTGGIYLPQMARKKTGFGTVLSIGKGYWVKNKWFKETTLKVGDRVLYNKDVPWKMQIEAPDGVERLVPLMGEDDIWCLIG